MSEHIGSQTLASVASDPSNWKEDHAERSYTLSFGNLDIRVNKARLNHGWEWGVYNQGNVVLQGQWSELRSEAQAKAVEFARRWMVDDIRI